MMWPFSSLLILSIIAANVVLLPEPVGPVTSTSPRGRSASCATTFGSPNSPNVFTVKGICRMTTDTQPRCLKTLPRKRARFWMPNEKSSSLSVSKRFFWFSVSTEYASELDFSFGIQNLARFRGNVFKQRGCVSVVIRQIPFNVKTFEELGLPHVVGGLADRPRGLVLVTGPTGSGKSTTLAAMIDKINKELKGHIITVEDPIEFIHRHQACIVNQREVGTDTNSFGAALKYALRQDPDVVLIGEMRDLETIAAALTIAETGHLAFATLHTNSAAESINRIIDVFPSHQQSQVRAQLAFVLEGVLTQTLLQRSKGRGRVMAAEIMICTPAIRALIRDDKVHQIESSMQAGSK